MEGIGAPALVGDIRVAITNGQRKPEEWAELFIQKFIEVADTAPQPIRDQARAFKARIQGIAAQYIRMAVDEERAFAATFLEQNGAAELARAVRSR